MFIYIGLLHKKKRTICITQSVTLKVFSACLIMLPQNILTVNMFCSGMIINMPILPLIITFFFLLDWIRLTSFIPQQGSSLLTTAQDATRTGKIIS